MGNIHNVKLVGGSVILDIDNICMPELSKVE